MLDVYKIRKDFPILGKKVNNTDLIYFDNAATSQTPNQVIDVISSYYKENNSNIPEPRDDYEEIFDDQSKEIESNDPFLRDLKIFEKYDLT